MACYETSPKQVSPPVDDPIAKTRWGESYRLKRLIDLPRERPLPKIRKTGKISSLDVTVIV